MAIFKRFRRKKRRKYPVKVDEKGRSARSRCFEMFAEKVPLHEIAEKAGVKVDTVRRYHQQWKKDPGLERRYTYVQSLFKKAAPDRDKNIELFARVWGITQERLETILAQPYGLRRLMTGKFYFPAHADADHKRHMALELALLISDNLTKDEGKFEDVYFALKRWMQENMKYREEEDADIREENKWMEFVHKVLGADMENERKGRVKPDTFSEEERDAIMRLGVEREMKKTEISYWFRIGGLMADGLTQEEAREKLYQDLLDKGDPKVTKLMREFQDEVHPLGKNDQMPPPSPPQPPSST
jgi:hypothetical protein